MLPRKHRLILRKKVDFFNNSKRYYSEFFTVFYHCLQKQAESKLAVVTPKKNFKKRVLRSKIKRQLANSALPLLKKTTRFELVIVAKPEIVKLTPIEISSQLEIFFNSLNK